MINYTKIQEGFKGLIGFRKSYGLNENVINDDLQDSTSGVYVNDLHDLFTVKNFLNIIQGPDNLVSLKSYNQQETYSKGDIIKHSNDIFISLIDNNIGQATTDNTKWKKTSILSEFLLNKFNFAVTQVVQKFLSFKKDLSQSKELLERIALFDAFGGEEINKQGSFVGYQINVLSPLLANVIKRVGVQLKEADTITLYLFHSSNNIAIATKELVYTNAKRFQWFDLSDFILKKTNETYEDGYFTIGYFESDLSTNNLAINANINLGANFDCSSCNYRNIQLIEMWSKYFGIRPIEITNGYLNGLNQSWGFDDAIVYDTKNFGLNLLFSVECDFTDTIIKNKEVFIPLLSEQLKLTFLNSIANTQRHNQDAIEASNLANYWLKEGKYEKNLQTALENASFDLSSLDKNCLPCDQTQKGIQVDVIW